MWTREIDGRALTFHLAGINNQNFLMRDEETGSFWQQITGQAVSGPLKGRNLTLVHCDELAFATWKAENRDGLVLRPVAKFAGDYEAKDWEKRIGKAPTVVDTMGTGHAPREVMLGIEIRGANRAFPLARVLAQKLVQDRVGDEPVILVVGADGISVRAFSARSREGAPAPDYFRTVDAAKTDAALFVDSASGANWNFQGCANGQCLKRLDMIKDYWFDWRLYHPRTTVYKR